MKKLFSPTVSVTTATLDIGNALKELKEQIKKGEAEEIYKASVKLSWELVDSGHAVAESVKHHEKGVTAEQGIQLTGSILVRLAAKFKSITGMDEATKVIENVKAGIGINAIMESILEQHDTKGEEALRRIKDLTTLLDTLKRPAAHKARPISTKLMLNRPLINAASDMVLQLNNIKALHHHVSQYADIANDKLMLQLSEDILFVSQQIEEQMTQLNHRLSDPKQSKDPLPPIQVSAKPQKGISKAINGLLKDYVTVYNSNGANIKGNLKEANSSVTGRLQKVIKDAAISSKPQKGSLSSEDIKPTQAEILTPAVEAAPSTAQNQLNHDVAILGDDIEQAHNNIAKIVLNETKDHRFKKEFGYLLGLAANLSFELHDDILAKNQSFDSSSSGSFDDMTLYSTLADECLELQNTIQPSKRSTLFESIDFSPNEASKNIGNDLLSEEDIQRAKTCLDNFSNQVRNISQFYHNIQRAYPKKPNIELETKLKQCQDIIAQAQQKIGDASKLKQDSDSRLTELLRKKSEIEFDDSIPTASKPRI